VPRCSPCSSALSSRKSTGASGRKVRSGFGDALGRNAAKMTDLEKQHATRMGRYFRSALPPDAIVMGDAHADLCTPARLQCRWEMERCWYYSGTYCSLGVALPMAIGGQDRRAASAGDRRRGATAGIMFTINELANGPRKKHLALPVIVWNKRCPECNCGADGPAADSAHRRWSPRARTSCGWRRASAVMPLRAASAEHLAQSVRDALAADRPTPDRSSTGTAPWLRP